MAQEIFQAVHDAERNADQRIQDAQKSARELLKETEAALTRNEREIAMEHRAMYQSILEERCQSVQDKLKSQHPAVEKAQEESLTGAKERLNSVAQRIFEGIWNDGNR